MSLLALLARSIPSSISSGEVPAVEVDTSTTAASTDGTGKMGGFVVFAKTILLPAFISLTLYLLLFHAILPLYRHHRTRYSQYLPLQNNTTNSLTSHLPSALHPSSLRDRFSTLIVRILFPSTWSASLRDRLSSPFRPRAGSTSTLDGEAPALFDEESGEAMIGFDVQERHRRRTGLERQVEDMDAARRTVSRHRGGGVGIGVPTIAVTDSDRRLSRELEEGFRDDSDDEDGEQSRAVAGRTESALR